MGRDGDIPQATPQDGLRLRPVRGVEVMARPNPFAIWGLGREESASTVGPVSPMPEPGDPCPGFIAQPGRCWQMIYSR
jgi:hypothetical protein